MFVRVFKIIFETYHVQYSMTTVISMCARVLDRLNRQAPSIGGILNSVVVTGRKDVPRLLNFMFGHGG